MQKNQEGVKYAVETTLRSPLRAVDSWSDSWECKCKTYNQRTNTASAQYWACSGIFSWIREGSERGAVISEGTTWVPGVSAYVKKYKVRHNAWGILDVTVIKWIPLGGYTTAVIMPDMTTGKFYGDKFKLESINTHSVLGHRFKIVVAEYSEWVSRGGWWWLDVKFDAGYGKHGIITIGFTSWPWFSDFLGAIGVTGAIGKGGKQLLKFISTGSTDALASAITLLLSGANIDALIFEEV